MNAVPEKEPVEPKGEEFLLGEPLFNSRLHSVYDLERQFNSRVMVSCPQFLWTQKKDKMSVQGDKNEREERRT